MLKTGILNPHVAALLARFRHTNTLVLADRGFPSWPHVETLDLSLTDDIPTVADVLRALLPLVTIGPAYMAEEFRTHNSPAVIQRRITLLPSLSPTAKLSWEPHAAFKLRVPRAIALIRTADTTPYANIILESA